MEVKKKMENTLERMQKEREEFRKQLKEWMRNMFESVRDGGAYSRYFITVNEEREYSLYVWHPSVNLDYNLDDDEMVIFNTTEEGLIEFGFTENGTDIQYFSTLTSDIVYFQYNERNDVSEEFISDWDTVAVEIENEMIDEVDDEVLHFYHNMYHFVDNDTIAEEVHYFETKDELINYVTQKGKFGVVSINEDDEDVLDVESLVNWTGKGYYGTWSWGNDHIERIDEIQKSLATEYEDFVKGNKFAPMREEEIRRWISWSCNINMIDQA